jgi:hypothetical protein
MTCERYRDVLSDVAAGAEAPAWAEAHLSSCAACRAELTALRQALAVADHELSRLLLAEPSPDLAARVRTAVAEPAEAASGWRFAWSFMAATAVAAGVVVTLLVAQHTLRPETTATVADRTPAHEAQRATPAPETAASENAPHLPPAEGRPRVSPPSRTAPAREPEVLVPAGETEALLRLVALVHRQRLAPTTLGAVGAPSLDLVELESIDIPPLEIVPLDPAEHSGT